MAANITLKSLSIEGQLFELLNQMQLKESLLTGTNAVNQIRLSIDTDTLSCSFSGTLEIALSVDNSGSVIVTPKVYLP